MKKERERGGDLFVCDGFSPPCCSQVAQSLEPREKEAQGEREKKDVQLCRDALLCRFF